MKKLIGLPSAFIAVLFCLGLFLGFGASGLNAKAAGGEKQCYYEVGDEPACDICMLTCLGSGYVCCDIVITF